MSKKSQDNEPLMSMQEATEIVLDLAFENVAPDEPEFAELRKRQIEAIEILQGFPFHDP